MACRTETQTVFIAFDQNAPIDGCIVGLVGLVKVVKKARHQGRNKVDMAGQHHKATVNGLASNPANLGRQQNLIG